MRFNDLEPNLSNLAIFNVNDIRKIDPGFHRQQLYDWQQRGFIRPLAGGYYFLADQEVDETFLFLAANQLYMPSYISLESALAYYQVIPESVLGVTSVSARKTRRLGTAWGQFTYRSVKPAYMFGYEVVIPRSDQKFLIASLEKAVLDYLYLNPHIQTIEDFKGIRWNRTPLLPLTESALFNQYLMIFNKQALEHRVKLFMRYLDA